MKLSEGKLTFYSFTNFLGPKQHSGCLTFLVVSSLTPVLAKRVPRCCWLFATFLKRIFCTTFFLVIYTQRIGLNKLAYHLCIYLRGEKISVTYSPHPHTFQILTIPRRSCLWQAKGIQVNTQIQRESRKASWIHRMETFRRQAKGVRRRDPSEERRAEGQPSLGKNRDI